MNTNRCEYTGSWKVAEVTSASFGTLRWVNQNWSELSAELAQEGGGAYTAWTKYQGLMLAINMERSTLPGDGEGADEENQEGVAFDVGLLDDPTRLILREDLVLSYSFRVVNSLPGREDYKTKTIVQIFRQSEVAIGEKCVIPLSLFDDESLGFRSSDTVIIGLDVTNLRTLNDNICPPIHSLGTDLFCLLKSGACSDIVINVNPVDGVGSVNQNMSTSSPSTVNTGSTSQKRKRKCTISGSVSNDVHSIASHTETSSSSSSSTTTTTTSSEPRQSSRQSSFSAHSFILMARSPYFRAMLSSPMAESSSREINEYDVQPAVFEEILRFMYTDLLSPGAMSAMGDWLMVAADKFGLDALKLLCETHLCQDLSVSNAAHRLLLSDQTRAVKLKCVCIEFIKQDLGSVMETSGWTQVAENPSLLCEILGVIARAPTCQRCRARSH